MHTATPPNTVSVMNLAAHTTLIAASELPLSELRCAPTIITGLHLGEAGDRPLAAGGGEDELAIVEPGQIIEDVEDQTRQGHLGLTTALGPAAGNGPDRGVDVDLGPLHLGYFVEALGGR